MIFALIIFILTYILMLSIPKYKHYIALGAAIIFVVFGILPVKKIFLEIDFNVLLMILGTMGTVSLFIESKMPDLISDKLIKKASNIKWMTIILAVFAGIVSAFIDNVATVLIIAPIVLVVAKKFKVSPVIPLICISIFSNLEGAATLTGDTTSLLLAKEVNMNFFDFFFFDGKIGLFFIVQFSLIAATLVLAYLQRRETKKLKYEGNTKVNDYIPTILLCLTIISLIIASFVDNKSKLTNGLICTFYFVVGLVIKVIKNKDIKSILINIKEIDYETLLLLASLFVVIGGIKEAGIIDAISKMFINIGDNPFVMYTVIVFVSVLISAFIDNIPYVATMLPVITGICAASSINPTLLYYGLIAGATLGGNFTPIGASANITAIGLLKKNGYNLDTKDYFKYSIPISLAAVLTSYIIILLLFI